MASAGRVLLISKGAWVSGTSYDPMDFVYYGGNSYVCKASVSGSTVPSSDTTHWQLMASGFDATLITQTITNDADKIASDAAVYAECQKLESNFAVIQSSNVASQAFSIGDYLTLEGVLYKVTSNIANGATIIPGTNVSRTDAGTQLNTLSDSLANKLASTESSFSPATSGIPWGNGVSVDWKIAIVTLDFGKNLSVSVQTTFVPEMLSSSDKLRTVGWYKTASDNGMAIIKYNLNSVRLHEWYFNGADITEASNLHVFFMR